MASMTSDKASIVKLQGHAREQLFKVLYERNHTDCVVDVVKGRKKPDVEIRQNECIKHRISVKSADKVIQWDLRSYNFIKEYYGDDHILTEFMYIRTNFEKPIQYEKFVDYFPRAIGYFSIRENFYKFVKKHFTNDGEVDLLAVGDGNSYKIYNFVELLDYISNNYVVKTSTQQIQINVGDFLLFSIEVRSDKKCLLIRQDVKSLIRVLENLNPIDMLSNK